MSLQLIQEPLTPTGRRTRVLLTQPGQLLQPPNHPGSDVQPLLGDTAEPLLKRANRAIDQPSNLSERRRLHPPRPAARDHRVP